MSNNSVFGFREICEGKSWAEFKGEKIYFLHQSIFDQCLVEEEREKNFSWANSHGYQSKKESIQLAIKNGLWSEEREKNFHSAIESLQNMWSRRAKGKTIGNIITQVRGFHEAINQMKSEIDSEAVQRALVSQNCSEEFSYRKSTDFEILLTARKENGEALFSEDEFDQLSDGEFVVLRNLYAKKILKFDELYFEKLVVSSFFFNIFDNYVANPGDFFKKAAPELSVFQISLLQYAKRYHEVMKIAYDAPQDFYEDPKMLETYAILKSQAGPEGEKAGQEEVSNDISEIKRKRN